MIGVSISIRKALYRNHVRKKSEVKMLKYQSEMRFSAI